MADTANNLIRLVRLAQHKGCEQLQVSVGTAKNVDEQKRICDIEIDTDLTLFNCRLNAVVDDYEGNVLVIPKGGSQVAFIAIDGQMTDVLVIGYSDIEKVFIKVGESEIEITDGSIALNGGDNKGLVKAQDLTQKLNTLEKDLNNLKSLFAGWTATPNDGGASLKTTLTAWSAATLTETQSSDLENDKVKH